MQRRRVRASCRAAHDRVAVSGDVDVHHRRHLRAIDGRRHEGGSLKPTLFHVEEHNLDAVPRSMRPKCVRDSRQNVDEVVTCRLAPDEHARLRLTSSPAVTLLN